jgi:chromosomal replication initiation ATPase DnaA
MDRSLAGARALVERIDRAALAENRALTRALAARVLDNPSETGA